ncbi:MAG: glycoside hydrolase family 88 protein [Rikenellaceae bacterium]
MRQFLTKVTFMVATLSTIIGCAPTPPTAEQIKELTQRVADWQIEHHEDQGVYRALPPIEERKKWQHSNKYPDQDWIPATLFAGMYQFTTITSDTKYVNWLNQKGQDSGFKLFKRIYHADDHCVGQFYLNLAQYYDKVQLYQPTRRQFDEIMASDKADDWHWNWCDALFMAPPVWTRLSKLTEDQRYLEYMDSQYHMTYDKLWSEEESLFYRDLSYLESQEENGKGVFWSRGNGWVFGGLAMMIPDMPSDWDGREFYVELFQTMAARLKELQREDGTWSSGLLGDVESYKNIETSGSSFFTFGLAWGINYGLLDRATYEPTLLKAWSAIAGAVNEDGMLGYVQGVGAAPGASYENYTELYGAGAFLAAGTQMYNFVNKFYTKDKTPRRDSKGVETFMKDGGWCWYQGPRAIINNGKLVIGGLNGKSGDVNIGVYDLEKEKIEGGVTLDKGFQCDDHNAPALYARPDGKIFTMWATHGSDKIHRYNISSADNYLEWGENQMHHHTYDDPRGVTYMNLYYMEDEKSLYSLFRDGVHFNPAYMISKDQGETWSEDTHLIANEVAGRNRPYMIYSQVDPNTIGIVYTDAHPRAYGNSLYYVELRGGKFYKADGTMIHDLKDGPLLTTHGEKIYKGSETNNTKPSTCESEPGASWNCNMVSDKDGNPHIGYTLYINNDDHRFRLISWGGKGWNDREIAYAGRCLYYWESSYTGLMAIDPTDTEVVYISTDVDPSTGKYLGGRHEIYTARVGASDDISTIKWEAVTKNSLYRNIRPIIVAKDGYKVLLWLNGEWNTYVNYDVDVVGRILERPKK